MRRVDPTLVQKFGHIYVNWVPSILYKELELRRIHRHFFHPQAELHTVMMKRADPEIVSAMVYLELEMTQAT